MLTFKLQNILSSGHLVRELVEESKVARFIHDFVLNGHNLTHKEVSCAQNMSLNSFFLEPFPV